MFTAGKFSSNDDLVNSLQAKGLLKTQTIIAAFRGVDRGTFFPSELLGGDLEVYDDKPLKIGVVHQSAPHMCYSLTRFVHPLVALTLRFFMYAHILELLTVRSGQRVLNVGSGTGYLSLLFAWFAGPNGTNHGIELHASNVELARRAVQRYFDEHDMFVPIKFLAGNVFDIDASANMKYDKIYCGAGCSSDQADFLKQLLDVDGQLLAPVTDASGSALVRFTRTSSLQSPAVFSSEKLMGVRFADLIPSSAPPSQPKIVLEAFSNSRIFPSPSSTVQSQPTQTPQPSGFLSTLTSSPPPTSASQVFISINVRSSAAIASRCAAFLQSHGIKSWICTQDLAGGSSFREEIVRAVQACSVFIALVTTEWALSGECEIEYNFALRLNLTSHEKGRTQRHQPRLPVIMPIAFPGLDWDAHPSIQLLAGTTNMLVHDGVNEAQLFTDLLSSLRATGVFSAAATAPHPAPAGSNRSDVEAAEAGLLVAAAEARAAAADAKLADAILQNARLSMQLAELKLENAKLRVGRL